MESGAGEVLGRDVKRCPRCGLIKPRTDFYRQTSRCKLCHRAVATLSWWRENYRQDDGFRIHRPPANDFDKGRRRWSELDDIRFMTMLVLGVPRTAASILTGRGAFGWEGQIPRLRAAYPPFAVCFSGRREPVWDSKRIARLERLVGIEGKSAREAARSFGCSRNAVIGAVQRHLPHLVHRKKRASVPSLSRPHESAVT